MRNGILTFVACPGDAIALRAFKVLWDNGYPVRVLNSGELADASCVALVDWTRKQRRGLVNGFPSNHVRIAPQKRIKRDALPPEVRNCGSVVYVRDGNTTNPEAFKLAVLAMAVHFRSRIKPPVATRSR